MLNQRLKRVSGIKQKRFNMEYILDDKKFFFSYEQLKEQYLKFKEMSEEEFFSDIPRLLHFACFIGWIKELGNECLISDVGIIHELIHLLEKGVEPVLTKEEIRNNFLTLLELK